MANTSTELQYRSELRITGECRLHRHTDNPRALPHTATLNMLLTSGYMAGIYYLSSIPGEAGLQDSLLSGIILWAPPALQNLLHIPLYGILAWLWHRTLGNWIKTTRLLCILAFMLATGFGILDEWHQLYVPGRYASVTDAALNALGAALAVWLISKPPSAVSPTDS